MVNPAPSAQWQPRLETERCTVRPASPGDLEAVCEAVRSPAFPRRLPLVEMEHEGRLSSWLEKMCARSSDRDVLLWSVDSREGARCIGQLTLAPRPHSYAWERAFAFWLNPLYWGRGLAVEAGSAVIRFAFETSRVMQLWAGIAHWNRRSIATVERLGFRFLCDNPLGYVAFGVPEPVREFALTKPRCQGEHDGG